MSRNTATTITTYSYVTHHFHFQFPSIITATVYALFPANSSWLVSCCANSQFVDKHLFHFVICFVLSALVCFVGFLTCVNAPLALFLSLPLVGSLPAGF